MPTYSLLQLAGIHQEFTVTTAGQHFLLRFWCLCLSNDGDKKMAQKEYLKMANMFHGGEHQSNRAGIGGVIDTNGEFILQAIENNYCSNMMQGDRNEYRDTIAQYAAHAINSHDELVAEVERLRGELHNALEKFHEADMYCQELQGIIDSLR